MKNFSRVVNGVCMALGGSSGILLAACIMKINYLAGGIAGIACTWLTLTGTIIAIHYS